MHDRPAAIIITALLMITMSPNTVKTTATRSATAHLLDSMTAWVVRSTRGNDTRAISQYYDEALPFQTSSEVFQARSGLGTDQSLQAIFSEELFSQNILGKCTRHDVGVSRTLAEPILIDILDPSMRLRSLCFRQDVQTMSFEQWLRLVYVDVKDHN